MELQVTMIYCICDEYLKSTQRKKEWYNVRISDAEVMTIVIVAMRYFNGNIENARRFLSEHGYIKNMLSKGQLNRRYLAIESTVWQGMLPFIRSFAAAWQVEEAYIVDSFPVSVCRNIRISRCRIFQNEAFRGYCASKKEYFYGVKSHVIVDLSGIPIKMLLSPGNEHDLPALKVLDPTTLPPNSVLYGDAAYIDYEYEDRLEEKHSLRLAVDRKSNSTRGYRLEDYVNLKKHRKTIESTFSAATSYLGKKIHAVGARCFEMKIECSLIAVAINLVFGL